MDLVLRLITYMGDSQEPLRDLKFFTGTSLLWVALQMLSFLISLNASSTLTRKN